jgi:hypothetical protein
VLLMVALPTIAQTALAALPDEPSAWQSSSDSQMKFGLPESPSRERIERSNGEQIYPAKPLREYPDAPSYTPLTRHQKYEYFLDGAKSGQTFVSAAVTAASWHAYGDPPYGTGWDGFGKSYGAALSQRELGFFLQRYAMPVMFREDPRYFAAPTKDGTFKRGMYAASRLVLTQADNGRTKINCSYLLGGLMSSLVGNAYIRQRDSSSVAQDFFINMGTDAAYNIAREFWPDMRASFPSKALRKLGDIVIGPHGLPNPNNK